MHSLADDVLAQHRPDRGTAIAAAREGCKAGALELNVAKHAVAAFDLAKKNGAPVAQSRHESTELVPGVGHCDRVRVVR